MKKVLVIVLAYGGLKYTERCLDELQKQTYPADVLVVDNSCPDKTADKLADRYPEYEFVKTWRNLGYAGGNNAGLNIAIQRGYDYALILNNDTVPEPTMIASLISAFDAPGHPLTAIAAPLVLDYDSNQIQWCGGHVNKWTGRCIFDKPTLTNRGTGYANGCCMLIRLDTLRHSGLFDSSFFLYWEETDLCERLWKAGYMSIVAPQARVHHKVSPGGGNPYYFMRNRWWYQRRHATRAQLIMSTLYFAFIELPKTITQYVLRGDVKRVKDTIRGTIDGIHEVI